MNFRKFRISTNSHVQFMRKIVAMTIIREFEKRKKIFRVLPHKCLKFWKANDNTIWGLIFREFIPKISDKYYISIITNVKAGVANTGSIFAIIPAYYHFRWAIFIFFILFGERLQIRIKLLIFHIHLPTHYLPKNIS